MVSQNRARKFLVKGFIVFIMFLFIALPLLSFTACGERETMTVYFNEITERNGKTDVLLNIKNNSNISFKLYAADFSIETKNGFKQGYAFRGGNIYEHTVTYNAKETSHVYIAFDVKCSELKNSSELKYLGQTIKVLEQNEIKFAL